MFLPSYKISRYRNWKLQLGRKITKLLSKDGKYVIRYPSWFRYLFRGLLFTWNDSIILPQFGTYERGPLFKIKDEWFVELTFKPLELTLYNYDIRAIMTSNMLKDLREELDPKFNIKIN